MYAKISVKGADMAPLYDYLTKSTGGDIKWNFTKFLIGKDGAIIARFESPVKPDDPKVTAAMRKPWLSKCGAGTLTAAAS